MAEKTPRSARRALQEVDRFVRSYAGGVRAEDFRRLFERDASAAYRVLSREEPAEPEEPFRRLLHRLRVVFLGLSYKLSPARRLLFLACLLFTLFGLLDWAPELRAGGVVVVDARPTWFLLAIAGLVFLFALELVDQIRVRDELEVARELQLDLLPSHAPELEGWRIVHTYRTANEVGGDYYDFFRLDDGRLILTVGDASGHGLAAGLLMAIANASLKLAIDLDPSPRPVLELVNRALCRTSDRRAFLSLFYSVLDPETGELIYAGAGHPYPMLRRRDGRIEELGSGGFPLGIRPTLRSAEERVRIEPGDRLLLFSDGLPEAVDAHDRAFGYERIRTLLREAASAVATESAVRAALEAHLGERALEDDFSLVVIERAPAIPPPPPA